MTKRISQDISGITVEVKENKSFTSYFLKDYAGKEFRATFNHINKKEITAEGFSQEWKEKGKLTILTEEEAEARHAGKLRCSLKLSKEMKEKDAHDLILQTAIHFGLRPYVVPMKDGINPLKSANGPYVTGFYFYAFSNQHGEDWVAYINYKTGDIWISSCELDWNWKNIHHDTAFTPCPMNDPEKAWLALICKMAESFKTQYEDKEFKKFPFNWS